MMADQNGMSMNERLRPINEIIRQIQKRSVLPMRLLDVARTMEDSLPHNTSSVGIKFDINILESDLVEAERLTFGSLPRPSFFRLGQSLIAWEKESILEKVRGVAGAGSWARHLWRETRRSLPRPRVHCYPRS